MGFFDLFRPLRTAKVSRWKEFGGYNSVFSTFNGNAYDSAIVRSCVRTLADFTAKSTAVCTDPKIEKILNERPNMYMSGHDFLVKVRTMTEMMGNCFIYIQRDDRLHVVGFYPVPYEYFEAVEYSGRMFIEFHLADSRSMTLPWEDLAVIRRDYNKSDIAGAGCDAILNTVELMQTVNEGLRNSIKATANLRGLLKITKGMLAPEKIKEQKDNFVRDYMNISNEGGIAALDSTQEFTPLSLNPMTANYAQMKEIRENIYRYFGVNDEIIMGTVKTEELENFYRLRIEPFLVAMSRELTSKVYTGKAAAYGNYISYQSENGQFMTMTQKIDLYNKVVLYGGITRNEWREFLGLPWLEGGDEPIMRLDAAPMDSAKFNGESDDGDEDPDEEENEDPDEIEKQFEELMKGLE